MQLAQPLPGEHYKKRGLVSFGYDHSGHGESLTSSRYALVVLEQVGNFSVPVFAKTWPPGTDEVIVQRDLVGFWRYFNPDIANGDAFGIGMMTSLNDDLFRLSLTNVDRRSIGDGESTASTWTEWPFSPMRFEGMSKHQMAQAVRSSYHNGQAALPYIDDHDLNDSETEDYRLLLRQLLNIVPEETKASYSSYKMAKKSVGDDLFDAYMAAQWGLVTRGVNIVPTAIVLGGKTRSQMMRQQATLIGG